MFKTIPASRQARWRLMTRVIGKWLRPLTDRDAISPEDLDRLEVQLGCRLPKALREWYQLAGNAHDIWSWQDRLVPPFIDREVLVFCFENQSVWTMGVRLGDLNRVDPPVFAWMNEAYATPSEFGQLNATASECALQYLAWSMKCANRNPRFACHLGLEEFDGYGSWQPATLAAIEHHCFRCAFPVWRLGERDNVFYESQDLLIQVGHKDAGGWSGLNATVRTKKALADFERMVRATGFEWAVGRWYTC
jgi:hypothetical protein